MSKNKLPSIESAPQKTEVQETSTPLPEVRVELVAIDIPYVVAGTGYESRRCDLGSLTGEQARKLNAIRRGYDYMGATRADGGNVKTLADAVKALIDSVEI